MERTFTAVMPVSLDAIETPPRLGSMPLSMVLELVSWEASCIADLLQEQPPKASSWVPCQHYAGLYLESNKQSLLVATLKVSTVGRLFVGPRTPLLIRSFSLRVPS